MLLNLSSYPHVLPAVLPFLFPVPSALTRSKMAKSQLVCSTPKLLHSQTFYQGKSLNAVGPHWGTDAWENLLNAIDAIHPPTHPLHPRKVYKLYIWDLGYKFWRTEDWKLPLNLKVAPTHCQGLARPIRIVEIQLKLSLVSDRPLKGRTAFDAQSSKDQSLLASPRREREFSC